MKCLSRGMAAAVVLITVAGCGSGGGGGAVNNGVGANIPGQPLGTLTTYPLTFRDMEKLTGKTFYLRADRGLNPGMKYPATLNGTDGTGGYRIAWLTSPLIIGSGDSGTPTYDEKGAISGALAFGPGGNSTFFGVTSIEDMMWAADHESDDIGITRGRAASSSRQLAGFAMGGLDPHRLDMLNKRAPAIAARFNRYRQVGADGTRTVHIPSKAPSGSTLDPGETFAVIAAEGPDFIAYAYGSVTMPYKGRYLCWGHPFSWAGPKQNFPVKRTTFVSMVDTTYGAYKHSVPFGQSIGTMTGDLQYCVVVDTRVVPQPIPVTYVYTIGSRTWSSKPETIYKVARMESFDVIAYASLGPVETAAHQLGAFDLFGSGTASMVFTMNDGSRIERSTETYKSSQVLSELWYGILLPTEDWNLTKVDMDNVKSIDVTLVLRDHEVPPPPPFGG